MQTKPTILELRSILQKHPIFSTLTQDDAERVFSKYPVEIRTFAAQEIAYSSASESSLVGILLSGRARVESGTGTGALLKSLTVGELFGVANLYAEDEPFPSTIVTTSPANILFLDGEAVRILVESVPSIRRAYLTFQSRRIVYLNRKIATLTAGSAEKKLAVFLLEYEQDGIFIPPCPMNRLAELLGMGRASLYRAIDALCDEGLVEKQGKNLLIRDKDALSRFI